MKDNKRKKAGLKGVRVLQQKWRDPEFREKTIAAMKKAANTEEAKRKRAEFNARRRMWKFTGRDDV